MKDPKIQQPSNWEEKFEAEFSPQKNSMNAVSKNITSLVIAHRLSTIKDAHHIYVLDNGNIIESGNHKHLLSIKGLYFQMWNLQKDTIV